MGGDRLALEAILDLAARVQRGIALSSEDQFTADDQRWGAAAFFLLHIGENAGRLSEGLRARHPELPWTNIVGMRHILAHAYDVVNPERLWDAAVGGLPALVAVCRSELEALQG